MKKQRCEECNRILTKLYRRDSATTPQKATQYLECRDCKEISQPIDRAKIASDARNRVAALQNKTGVTENG